MSDELVDASRLSALVRELAGDTAACARFLDDFVAAWEPRRDRVLAAVGERDVGDALAALLSLASSSAMVGAGALSAAARRLHESARATGTLPAESAHELVALGAATIGELRRLGELGCAAPGQPAASDPVSR